MVGQGCVDPFAYDHINGHKENGHQHPGDRLRYAGPHKTQLGDQNRGGKNLHRQLDTAGQHRRYLPAHGLHHIADAEEDAVKKSLKQYNKKQPYFRKIDGIWMRKEPLPRAGLGKLKRNVVLNEYEAGEM